jgi:hypothetical protein
MPNRGTKKPEQNRSTDVDEYARHLTREVPEKFFRGSFDSFIYSSLIR